MKKDIEKKEIIILFVGVLCEKKGLYALIQTMPKIIKIIPSVNS